MLDQDLSAAPIEMDPLMDLSDYFTSAPPPKSLHVIVDFPTKQSDEENEEKDKLSLLPKTGNRVHGNWNRLRSLVDISRDLTTRWSRTVAAPTLKALQDHPRQPLTEEEKVPAKKESADSIETVLKNTLTVTPPGEARRKPFT